MGIDPKMEILSVLRQSIESVNPWMTAEWFPLILVSPILDYMEIQDPSDELQDTSSEIHQPWVSKAEFSEKSKFLHEVWTILITIKNES